MVVLQANPVEDVPSLVMKTKSLTVQFRIDTAYRDVSLTCLNRVPRYLWPQYTDSTDNGKRMPKRHHSIDTFLPSLQRCSGLHLDTVVAGATSGSGDPRRGLYRPIGCNSFPKHELLFWLTICSESVPLLLPYCRGASSATRTHETPGTYPS